MKKKRTKKRKFIRPAAGLKPGGPTKQLSHVGVRYHKGFVYDQLRYSVLTLTQLSEVDKSLVLSTLKTITTAAQAMTLPAILHKDGNPKNNKRENLDLNGWACTCIDQLGKCYVLSFHGIEVALFYKRQLTTIKLNPGDHHPEGCVQDPEDAWMRLDLLGQSAKRSNLVTITTMNQLKDENKLLTTRIKTLEELNDTLEKAESLRQEKIQRLEEAKKKKWRKR
jgi:hypothetical protein